MTQDTKFTSILNSDKRVYLFHFLCLLLIYWPITLLMYNFKWDMLDGYFPFRYHVSLSIQNGEFPLWNAHEMGGYPIYADPQSGVFYPMVWILSFVFGRYSVFAINVEFLLTAFIAATCFYKLCRFFSVSIPTAALAGLFYACSGVFIGNTQHLNWLISAAYLPGILYCFFSLSTTFKYKYGIALSLLLYLHLASGYPAFSIILFYLLIIVGVYFFFLHLKSGQLKKYSILCGSTLLLTLLLSFAFLYSVYSVTPFINRATGVSLELAMQNAFTFPSFLSFVLPFATCRHAEILGTDISMANAYFGLFFVLCLPLYLLKTKKTTLEKIILALGIICLLASVGEALPFRKWLFYLPMMNYFRFPSAFRIFVVLFFLLLAAIQLDKQKNDPSLFRKFLFTASGIFILTIIISLIKNYSGTSAVDFFVNKSFFNIHSTIHDHIILQATVQLLLLAVFLTLTFFYKNHFTKILYFFILADIVFSVHLNLPYTSLDYGGSQEALNKKILQQPDITFIPTKKIYLNNDHSEALSPLWRNLQDYQLEIGYDGYNPFGLTLYDSLFSSPYFKRIIQNYPVYLAEQYINPIDSGIITSNKIVVTDTNSYINYKQRKSSPGDTCRIIAISGNTMTIEASVTDTSTLVIFQNFVPGWHCKVNQTEQDIERLNISLMGIKLPPGKSITELEYSPKGIYFLIWVNFISLLVSGGILFFCIRKNS